MVCEYSEIGEPLSMILFIENLECSTSKVVTLGDEFGYTEFHPLSVNRFKNFLSQ